MKKILLLSDIHANTVALQSVLNDVDGFDEILCAGDLVDYNPWPLEVIEMVRANNVQSVIGNHDRDSALGTPFGYNPFAEASCRWTYNKLGPEERHYLLSLPEKLLLDEEGMRFYICHGSPNDLIDEYVFPPPMTSKSVLRSYLVKTEANVLILGHTHVPFIEEFSEGYVINPGSVGQPRSGDPRASYVVVVVEDGNIELKHCLVNYDIDEVVAKIVEVGLPRFLASRLYSGV